MSADAFDSVFYIIAAKDFEFKSFIWASLKQQEFIIYQEVIDSLKQI